MASDQPQPELNNAPISAHKLGVNVPHIPSRAERRKRAKSAGVFKHKGGWKHVNDQAYMQRDNAINKAVDLANKKRNMKS